MGRKIFVSYKYSDIFVEELAGYPVTRARDYVTELQNLLDQNDHINKGENDGEDLSHFKDSTIEDGLKSKIFDSTLTIVMISKGMKDITKLEADQWIPWEISYSLREITRGERRSSTNAILAVVLPDIEGSYDYFIEEHNCASCDSRLIKTNILFDILKNNMFNIKSPTYVNCDSHADGGLPYSGFPSYIDSVKWCDFILSPNTYLDIAYSINARLDDYNLTKLL